MGKSSPVAQTVRQKVSAAEQSYPGVCLELVLAILKKADPNANVHEAILRLQGSVDDSDGEMA